MKKIILFLSLLLIFSNQAFSAEPIKIMKDNTYLELSVNPIKKDGRVFVPLSDIAKTFNTKISWEFETKTISYQNKDGITYNLKVGSSDVEIIKNNDIKTKKIDVAPIIFNNKVFIPIRFIAESFNVSVDYDSWYNVVYLGNCKKLGYYDEFPDVPSFSRIEKGSPEETNGMPKEMIYKHTITKFSSSKAMELYLKLLKSTGFTVDNDDLNYNETQECDIEGNCKVVERKLDSFTAHNEQKHLLIKVKSDISGSYIDTDYQKRTKTVYFGNSIIVVRVINLNPPKFDDYWNVKTVQYN